MASHDSQIDNLSDGYVVAKDVVDTFEERLTTLETVDVSFPTVSSVEEMTDTEQSYILASTGTIWEYQQRTEQNYTNQIPISTDASGNIVGLIKNHRYNSSDTLVLTTGADATGYIPIKAGDVVRFKNIIFRNCVVNDVSYGSYYIRLYDELFTMLGYAINGSLQEGAIAQHFADYKTDSDGDLAEFTVSNTFEYAYMRMAFVADTEEAIITVNESIGSAIVSEWVDTGVSGVSGSYNIGAVALKVNRNTSDISTHEKRISLVEKYVSSNSSTVLIPDYWKTHIDSLEDKIENLQNAGGANSFQFLLVSDIHGTNGYTNSNGAGTSATTYIGAISRYTMDKFNIPFLVISGDIMSQSSHSSEASVWNEYENLKSVLEPVGYDELLATKGNHDGAWGSPVTIDGTAVYYLYNIGTKKVYNAIYRKQAKDRKRVFGHDGTYFYVDYHNMRIFMLNAHTDGDESVDENGYAKYNPMKNSVYGQKQLEWLCDSLMNMNENQKAIIVSHPQIALSHDGSILSGIITAFNNKTSYSNNVTVSADYWGEDSDYANISINKNFSSSEGKILAYFHGHNHKDIIDTATYSFPRIAITTAGGDVRDANPVERVPGTATETAMDIVTINDNGIFMTRIGAGNDREVTF